MLRWIRIENIAVIDQIAIDLEPGLNLLTGETGAGKSILIDSLGLALGNRASGDIVRSGARAAFVEVGFEIEPMSKGLSLRLDDAGVPVDSELVIRRELTQNGRGKVYINGRSSSRSVLRDIAGYLVDIHGQGDNLSLLRPNAALELLDRYGGSGVLRAKVTSAFRDAEQIARELEDCERANKERDSRKELSEFVLSELSKAELSAGEEERLIQERNLASHAEKLKTLSDGVYRELYEEDTSVLSRLSGIFKGVDELSDIDSSWKEYVKEREGVVGQLEDLALRLRDYREEVQVQPGKLDEIQSRLAILERIKKKYGGTIETAIEKREQCALELKNFEGLAETLASLRTRYNSSRDKYNELAGELSRMRSNAAKKLQTVVIKELASLSLEKADFRIRMSSCDWRDSGLDIAELLFSANPGEEPNLLSRVASGGELSRFMLALKAVTAKDEQPKVFVFDEVDAGIGGRVADVVGEKLFELSGRHQVICVTHLPQIASFAPSHFRINKVETDGRIETRISRLDQDERIAEIARMLAGAAVTESAREHARQLINDKIGKHN